MSDQARDRSIALFIFMILLALFPGLVWSQPNPILRPVDIEPEQIVIGESFEITVEVENSGDDAGYGSIDVSFPNLTGFGDGQYVSVVNSSNASPGLSEFENGDQIWHANDYQFAANYLLIEHGQENWSSGTSHYVTLEVTPQETGTFPIYVRGNMGVDASDGPWYNDPRSSSYSDQQGWPVERYEVQVKPPAGNLELTVRNIENGNDQIPRDNGNVVLYGQNGGYVESAETNAVNDGTGAGVATFANLDPSKTYKAQVFHDPANTVFGSEEYWGEKQYLTVPENGTQEESFRRYMPYVAEGVKLYQGSTEVTGESVPAGTQLTARVVVRNDDNVSRRVRVRLAMDRSRGGGLDYTSDWSEYKEVAGSGGMSTLEVPVTLPEAGEYYLAYEAEVEDSPIGDQFTDGSRWTSTSLITITAPPSAPADEISGQPSEIRPTALYTVTARYYDADGREDLKYLYLRLNHPFGRDLTLGWNQNTDEFFPWDGEQGASFLKMQEPAVSPIDGSPEGYQVTWKFSLNGLWDVTDDGITFGAYAEDESGLTSRWNYDNSSSAFKITTGVTVLTHGLAVSDVINDNTPFQLDFDPISDVWREDFIRALLESYGGGRVYVYDPQTGAFDQVRRDSWSGLDNQSDGEQILIHDWAGVSGDGVSGHAESAGAALFSALVDPDGDGEPENKYVNLDQPRSSRPFHFIGHSRGTSVVSETVQRLGTHDITVDYVTYLDVHDYDEPIVPLDHLFHDPAVQVWNNISYADNFWQAADQNDLLPSGRQLQQLKDKYVSDYFLNPLPGFNDSPGDRGTHSRVKRWYLGTISPGTQSKDWYRDGLGYDTGFSLWRKRGGYDYKGQYDGFSKLAPPANPITLENLQPFPINTDANQDDDDAPTDFFMGSLDLPDLVQENGGVEDGIGEVAGWSYHGGLTDGWPDAGVLKFGKLVPESGAITLSEMVHNRFYIPSDAAALTFDYKFIESDTDDGLVVSLSDNSGGYDGPGYSTGPSITSDFQTASINLGNVTNSVRTLKIEIRPGGNGIIDSEIYIDNIRFAEPKQACANINVTEGWTLVSIPVKVPDMSLDALFPDPEDVLADSTYGYDASAGRYVTVGAPGNDRPEFEVGKGYWFYNYGSGQTFEVCGQRPESYETTIDEGWNMIGAPLSEASTSSVTSSPSSIYYPTFFGWTGGSYNRAEALVPGKGYWLYGKESGTLQLDGAESTAGKQLAAVSPPSRKNWIRLIVTEAGNHKHTLHLSTDPVEDARHLLPPPAPGSERKVRFRSGQFVEHLNAEGTEILMEDLTYPITLKVRNLKGQAIKLQNASGTRLWTLRDKEPVTITSSTSQLILSRQENPSEFKLHPNYPNPFAQRTSIRFSLPDPSHVRVSVFNALGQEVRQLANEKMEAGVHRIDFTAQDLASGVYFYSIQAGDFTDTQKMVVLK